MLIFISSKENGKVYKYIWDNCPTLDKVIGVKQLMAKKFIQRFCSVLYIKLSIYFMNVLANRAYTDFKVSKHQICCRCLNFRLLFFRNTDAYFICIIPIHTKLNIRRLSISHAARYLKCRMACPF